MSGPFALLRIPSFFVLWLGGGLVGAMRWLEVLAIGIWTFAETGSAVMVALMMVLRQLPMLPLGPFIRSEERRVGKECRL